MNRILNVGIGKRFYKLYNKQVRHTVICMYVYIIAAKVNAYKICESNIPNFPEIDVEATSITHTFKS